tara:strand:+ start:1193 stop:1381 length:189 start_codon:yes stop_codon:yes gene_type:complete
MARKTTKICRLCNASYVVDLSCCENYCQECSKFHNKLKKRRAKESLQSHSKHSKIKKNDNSR